MLTLSDIKNAWTLIPGLAMTFCALYFLIANTFFWIAADSAQGKVIGSRTMERLGSHTQGSQESKAALVTFTDKQNQEVTFSADFGSGSGFYKDGAKVTVIYDPDNPENAKIREFKALYLGPFLLLFMGLVFSIIGMLLMPYDKSKRRRYIKNKS